MKPILFYDGYCPMCNGWVRRLIRWDRRGRIHFAALDGETARQVLTPLIPDYLAEDTIILYADGRVFLRSEAVLQIFRLLGGVFFLLTVGRFIPRAWRDRLYAAVAAQRYRFGARYATCPLPPAAARMRFLP